MLLLIDILPIKKSFNFLVLSLELNFNFVIKFFILFDLYYLGCSTYEKYRIR